MKAISAQSSILILSLCGLSLLCCACQDPPVSSLEKAHSALEMAALSGAVRHAETLYRQADSLLLEGRLEMARQNARPAWFRNYRVTDSLFASAFETAGRAARNAQGRLSELQAQAESERQSLGEELGGWRGVLVGSLKAHQAQFYCTSADLSLKMSELLVLRGEYEAAIEVVAGGRKSLLELSRIFSDYANDEAQKLKIWRRWVRGTLASSAAGKGAAIIVDKEAHKLYLVESGRLIHSYDCELGYNSAGQKYFAGDGATPEGKYHITNSGHAGSKYYKALIVSYPNQLDRKRFAEYKQKGIISASARIGALIEIHGEGGKNKDWTDGCIALKNNDMDHLMQYVSVGTPVTIVRRSDLWP